MTVVHDAWSLMGLLRTSGSWMAPSDPPRNLLDLQLVGEAMGADREVREAAWSDWPLETTGRELRQAGSVQQASSISLLDASITDTSTMWMMLPSVCLMCDVLAGCGWGLCRWASSSCSSRS